MQPPPKSQLLAPRLSAYYAAIFLVVGIKTPFWPVFLAGRGLGATEIAAVFAAAIWFNVIATPLIGAAADRLDKRRATMVVLAGIAIAAYAMLWRTESFWPLLVLTLIAAGGQSAIMPLGDSITLAAVRDDGLVYGRVRLWGSVSFIAAASGSGWWLATVGSDTLGSHAVLALVLAASTAVLAACLAIPAPNGGGRQPSRRGDMWVLARDHRFWRFIALSAAIQASHQAYYGFGTLYWRSLGFSDTVIGALWAEGVMAEIALFWGGAYLLARLGPLGLIMAGGAAGIVRWSLMGLVPGLLPAAMLQLLHGLTFGATHLGAMNYLARTVPPGAAASAQALYAAASAGLGSGIVMLGAGALYAAFGARSYVFMAALAAAGLAAAIQLARLAPQRPHF